MCIRVLLVQWLTYYDILVRHAMGNMRDLIYEVSFSPMMGMYLSYERSASLASSGTDPDENYARELMQLFTIGLVELQDDGSLELGSDGAPIQTYSMDNIKEFARCWTGFAVRPMRGNIEPEDLGRLNHIDPMQIMSNGAATRRDLFPKINLYGGYLGDGEPLCADLPPRHFLSVGARWSFLGSSPQATLQPEALFPGTTSALAALGSDWPERVPRLRLNPRTSSLHRHLCGSMGSASTPAPPQACNLRSEVRLPLTLPCDGDECDVDTATVVDVVDPATNITVYYEYVRRPCVVLAFFHGASIRGPSWHAGQGHRLCADPATESAAAACCPVEHTSSTVGVTDCRYVNEAMTHATAVARCAARADGHTALCSKDVSHAPGCFGAPGMQDERKWYALGDERDENGLMNEEQGACRTRVQVFSHGMVSLVHSPTSEPSLTPDSGNVFRVAWEGGKNNHPKIADSTCPQGCDVHGITCLCDTDPTMATVIGSVHNLSAADVVDALHVGSAPPEAFAAGIYMPCTSAACTDALARNVSVFTHRESGGALDERTIFGVMRNGSRPTYLMNKVATVRVANGAFAFRNPVSFHSFARPSIRDAEHETAALIDHLFTHKNHPPFISRLLIQRMTTSNPSPRYVKVVASAFKEGSYGGVTYSGVYGDLGATFAAILLDSEARSSTLDADPTHGRLREPLLKVYAVLRSLEWATGQGQFSQLDDIEGAIGQQHFMSPTVFNFYDPTYQPEGPLTQTGLVAPEAQLATGPFAVGLQNWLATAVRGWTSMGIVHFTPTADATDASAVVGELDLLLTAGRLNSRSRSYIISRYAEKLAQEGATEALRHAQELFTFTSEFHATNLHEPQDHVLRTFRPPTPSQGRPYKALVYVFLNGGADSWNLLVPHSGCVRPALEPQYDLYEQYAAIRTRNAIPKDDLLVIDSDSDSQPCSQFGVHPKMTTLKSIYDEGDAAMLSNVGTLVEPLNREGYWDLRVPKPPSLYSHSTQSNFVQNVHAHKSPSAKGVLGRILSALSSPSSAPPFKVQSYSIAGHTKLLEGGPDPPEMLSTSGPVRLARYAHSRTHLAELTKLESSSVFAETYSRILHESVEKAESMAHALNSDEVTLSTSFGWSTLNKQLEQVARVIGARGTFQNEREAFFVEDITWDAHQMVDVEADAVSGYPKGVHLKWEDLNSALASFVTEMKAQGMWENVTIVMASDFGRALATNGRGTDHGWGGNAFMMGGAVKGGILGKYPADLHRDSAARVLTSVIPTMSYEAVWHGLAQWMGVEDGAMEEVLPNKRNFECTGRAGCGLLKETDMFKGSPSESEMLKGPSSSPPTAPTPNGIASPSLPTSTPNDGLR